MLLRFACLDPRLSRVLQLLPALNGRQRTLARIQRLETRTLLLVVVHRLLARSGPVLGVRVTDPVCSDATLRTVWFWMLMRPRTESLLRILARRWPEGYVRRCWPDLLDRQTDPMLHRLKVVRVYQPGPLPPSLQSRNLRLLAPYLTI
jgi:hypothetical protein